MFQLGDCVQYVCSCGSLKPISRIYFCRHCLSIRCSYCLCNEVDSFYCPNCMENLPASEVRLKKNKCNNCFECPCCFQTLSIRAGQVLIKANPAIQIGDDSSKPATKKVYYLNCSSCRWSSRDAGIPDQSVATGSWPEQENPYAMRINSLISYHKILASREKQHKERKKFHTKRTYMQFEKFGMTSALARKLAGFNSESQSQSDQVPAAVASESVEDLPSEIFTKNVDLTKVTTIEQRLKYPELQAEFVNELRPQHRHFVVKRSQRCRSCEHNVSKPDYCPTSIKFKIQLSALFHVPEVRIVSCEPLVVGKTSELLLKFCNPTQHQTVIMLLPPDTSTSTAAITIKQESCDSPNLLPTSMKNLTVTEEAKKLKIVENAIVSIPTSAIILPPKDDAAEYDDPSDAQNFHDDASLIVWRKGNKAVIRLHLIPSVSSGAEKGESVITSLVMQYSYVNTISTLEHKVPQKLDLKAKLFLTVGKIIESSN